MSPRSSTRTLPFAAFALATLGSVATAADLRPEYVEILRQYARGERTEAVTAVATWSEREIEQQLGAVQARVVAAERCPTCPNAVEEIPVRAAVMLHADRDEAERPSYTDVEQPRPCPGRQARIAGNFAGLLARLPEQKDFARRFFLAMTLRSQFGFCMEDARRWARDGLGRFPRDPELLLSLGSVHEEGATLETASALARMTVKAPVRNSEDVLGARAREKWYEEARRSYREALAIAPGLVPARVHLGRVHWRLGEGELARTTLVEALQQARDPLLQHLTHLFLGQVYEDSDQLTEAVAEYRAALELDPHSQTAAVALSHAVRGQGDAESARQILERGLSRAGRRSGRDAYWEYIVGTAGQADEMFAALRRETLQ